MIPDVELYRDERFLNIAAFHPGTTCLGPGKRAILWLQGCVKRCKGCITPEMQAIKKVEFINVFKLADFLNSISGIEGITLVGGEPLLQYRALSVFLPLIKSSGLSVMLYTGYLYEEILKHSSQEMKLVLENVDILVDGPYEIDKDHGEMWRGSSNQRIIFLTERYKEWEWVKNVRKRQLSIHYDSRGRYVILGIPPSNYPLPQK